MITLANQYKLIQEGKGDVDFFKKSAINQMGGVLTNLNSFEDMVNILKNKGIITEEEECCPQTIKDIKSTDIKYLIDTSKTGEEFTGKLNDFIKNKKGIFAVSPDQGKKMYDTVKKQTIDKLMMKENVKDDAKVIYDADRVNPYELLKGIKMELDVDYEVSTEEDVMKAKKKAVKNIQSDPLYYTNKIAGVKKVAPEKRADTMKLLNKKRTNVVDDMNAMKSLVKKPKANVTDKGEKENVTRRQMKQIEKKSLNEIITSHE